MAFALIITKLVWPLYLLFQWRCGLCASHNKGGVTIVLIGGVAYVSDTIKGCGLCDWFNGGVALMTYNDGVWSL